MRILLHTCCAPCTIYPLGVLREEGIDATGFFYRHNIHPYTEMRKREAALEQYADIAGFPVIYQDGYDLEGFLRGVVFRESERCRICYRNRLNATALLARREGFDAFTSTLLYSRYQDHEQIRQTAAAVAASAGIAFLYRDFRPGWKEGIEASKRLALYRQPYCGCIFSERERYLGRDRRPKPQA